MFSRLKHQLPTFLTLGAGLLIMGLITVLGGFWNYQNELDGHLTAASSQPVIVPAAHENPAGYKGGVPKTGSGGVTSDSSSGSQTGTPAYGTGSFPVSTGTGRIVDSAPTSPAHTKTDSTTQTVISVRLTINGHGGGTVKLASGSNQCDVLSDAKTEGMISYLDMRYNSSQGSYGVYVINGIGEPGSVWWTYTVNGNSPPGCSHVPAHNGDSVNWQYIKR